MCRARLGALFEIAFTLVAQALDGRDEDSHRRRKPDERDHAYRNQLFSAPRSAAKLRFVDDIIGEA